MVVHVTKFCEKQCKFYNEVCIKIYVITKANCHVKYCNAPDHEKLENRGRFQKLNTNTRKTQMIKQTYFVKKN